MERVKDYLMMLARHIEAEIDDQETLEDVDEVAEMCEDYNHIYKFYCHHKCLKEGHDPRMAGHHDVAPHDGMTHMAAR